MSKSYERRYRNLVANLGIIHGELRQLIEDMGTERHALTFADTRLFSRLRGDNMKLDAVIKEMQKPPA